MECGSLSDQLVKKPWGWENRFAITDRYLGKLIHINAGEMLSLQYHERKDETVFVTRGVMDLQLEDETGVMQTHRLTPGMARRIRPGQKHRMIGAEECEFFEVSSPEIDDVVRLDDKYGRQGTSTA
ncbi:MAG TPA: cupin domain-containing protein [Candidatus Dormibacteraeota bacterium]